MCRQCQQWSVQRKKLILFLLVVYVVFFENSYSFRLPLDSEHCRKYHCFSLACWGGLQFHWNFHTIIAICCTRMSHIGKIIYCTQLIKFLTFSQLLVKRWTSRRLEYVEVLVVVKGLVSCFHPPMESSISVNLNRICIASLRITQNCVPQVFKFLCSGCVFQPPLMLFLLVAIQHQQHRLDCVLGWTVGVPNPLGGLPVHCSLQSELDVDGESVTHHLLHRISFKLWCSYMYLSNVGRVTIPDKVLGDKIDQRRVVCL